MRLLENKTDEEEYTKFLENHERCNFQQSLEWARVKTSWKREVILAEDENKKIIGSLMVWKPQRQYPDGCAFCLIMNVKQK